MIFVTMGTQIPFDRFLQMLDSVVPDLNGEEIVAQSIADKYKPVNFAVRGLIAPDEFKRIAARARVIVSHAGMGSILTSLTLGKPIIVVPRLASLGEHRNEHQLATTSRLSEMGYIYVANTSDELRQLLLTPDLKVTRAIGPAADRSLADAIISEIQAP